MPSVKTRRELVGSSDEPQNDENPGRRAEPGQGRRMKTSVFGSMEAGESARLRGGL